MFVATATRTMASAKQVMPYDPDTDCRPLRRRSALIEASRRWQEAHERREAERQAQFNAERAEKRERRARQREAKLFRVREQERVREHISRMVAERSSIEEIIIRVAAWHGRKYSEIIGQSRNRELMVARHDAIAAVYLIFRSERRHLSLPEMGRAFGGRDHTTILHALRQRGIERHGWCKKGEPRPPISIQHGDRKP